MTLYRVSINGEDPVEFEAYTPAGAAAQAEMNWDKDANERRQVETLIVHRAERARWTENVGGAFITEPTRGPEPR